MKKVVYRTLKNINPIFLAGFFISCQFTTRVNCETEIKKDLNLSENERIPPQYQDYCACYSKWISEGYSVETSDENCRYTLENR